MENILFMAEINALMQNLKQEMELVLSALHNDLKKWAPEKKPAERKNRYG